MLDIMANRNPIHLNSKSSLARTSPYTKDFTCADDSNVFMAAYRARKSLGNYAAGFRSPCDQENATPSTSETLPSDTDLEISATRIPEQKNSKVDSIYHKKNKGNKPSNLRTARRLASRDCSRLESGPEKKINPESIPCTQVAPAVNETTTFAERRSFQQGDTVLAKSTKYVPPHLRGKATGRCNQSPLSRESTDEQPVDLSPENHSTARIESKNDQFEQHVPPHLRRLAGIPRQVHEMHQSVATLPKANERPPQELPLIPVVAELDNKSENTCSRIVGKVSEEGDTVTVNASGLVVENKNFPASTENCESNVANEPQSGAVDAVVQQKRNIMASRFKLDYGYKFKRSRYHANDFDSPLLSLPNELIDQILGHLLARSEALQKFASMCQSAFKAVSYRFLFYNFSRRNYSKDEKSPFRTIKNVGFSKRAFIEIFYEPHFHANNRRIQEKLSLICMIRASFNYGHQVQHLELTRVPLVTVQVVRRLLRNMPNLRFIRIESCPLIDLGHVAILVDSCYHRKGHPVDLDIVPKILTTFNHMMTDTSFTVPVAAILYTFLPIAHALRMTLATTRSSFYKTIVSCHKDCFGETKPAFGITRRVWDLIRRNRPSTHPEILKWVAGQELHHRNPEESWEETWDCQDAWHNPTGYLHASLSTAFFPNHHMTVTGPEVQCWGCRLQDGLRRAKAGGISGCQLKEVGGVLGDIHREGIDAAEASIHAERRAHRNGAESWEEFERRKVEDAENEKRRANGLGPRKWVKVRTGKKGSIDRIDCPTDPSSDSVWDQYIGDGSSGPGEWSKKPPGYWYSAR